MAYYNQLKEKKNTRAAAREKLTLINNRIRSENLITSATLPTWNSCRLAYQCDKLSKKLGHHCSDYRLAFICLNLLQKRLTSTVPPRATFYNDDKYSYFKIGIVFKTFGQYQRYRTIAGTSRTSLSHMLDIAIRLYLDMAARIYYLESLGINLKSKWKQLTEGFCIYTEYSASNAIKLQSKDKKPPD